MYQLSEYKQSSDKENWSPNSNGSLIEVGQQCVGCVGWY